MKSIAKDVRLHTRSAPEWERIVMAEVLVPDTPNVFNDYWTKENIKQAAYAFMQRGFGIDIEHDNVDVTGAVHVVESFIARSGDPDFIEGSWVIGMYIADDVIWQDILDGKINGYSYEALVSFMSATLQVLDDGIRQGITEEDPIDGHSHIFMVMVDVNNRPIDGGTSEENGHAHTISTHTITDEAAGHVHRYNLVTGKDGK